MNDTKLSTLDWKLERLNFRVCLAYIKHSFGSKHVIIKSVRNASDTCMYCNLKEISICPFPDLQKYTFKTRWKHDIYNTNMFMPHLKWSQSEKPWIQNNMKIYLWLSIFIIP